MARSTMPVRLVEAAVWYLIGLAGSGDAAGPKDAAGPGETAGPGDAAGPGDTAPPFDGAPELRAALAQELGIDPGDAPGQQADAVLDRVLELISAGRAAAAADPATTISAAVYGAQRERALAALGAGTGRGLAPWPPTQQTVMKRLGDGSWAQALSALGLRSAAGRERGRLRFDDAGYTQAVADFVLAAEAAGSGTAYSAYVEWCAAQKEAGISRPSGSALRVRFGSWNAALAEAAL